MSRIACKIFFICFVLAVSSRYALAEVPYTPASSNDATSITSSRDMAYKWTSQSLPGSTVWWTIASSSNGTGLIAAEKYGYIYTSSNSGKTWTKRTSAGEQQWVAVASSSDGTRLVAVAYGDYIYTSADSGATWTGRTSIGSQCWQSVASSSDGMKLVAVENGDWAEGYIYTSTDSGATWTAQTDAGGRNWIAVSSSSDGATLITAEYGGYVYISTNSGMTWTEKTRAGSRKWLTVASSLDGTKFIAAGDGGFVYTSTDSGETWTEQTGAGSRKWLAVACSSDGTILIAAEKADEWGPIGEDADGYIYTSTDSGANWTQQTSVPGHGWVAVAATSDGARLVAAESQGYIYSSADAGITWNQQMSPGKSVAAVASSSDGTKLVAASGYKSYLCTSTDSGATWTQQISAGRRRWDVVVSSFDGTRLVAKAGELFYKSTDSAATWTEHAGIPVAPPPIYPTPVVLKTQMISSSDGTKVVAANFNGFIYTSANSGATWTERTSAGNHLWYAVASSSDGTKLFAADYEGYINISTDSGATWTEQTSVDSRGWYAVACSSDGTRVVAVCGGYMYTSFDSGATWTKQTNLGEGWGQVASSSDGMTLVAGNGYYIYISGDAGATWTQQTSGGEPYIGSLMMITSDGSKVIIGSDTLFIGSAPAKPSIDTPTTSSLTTTSATLGATIESDGGASITATGIAYGPDANPGITGSIVNSAVTSGPFTVDVTGLTSNTVYHFRGYATNALGTNYTTDSTLTTIASAPTATAAAGVTSTGFTANWTAPSGTALITGYRLDVATDSGFTAFVADCSDLAVAGTSTAVIGLSSSATYYYRVRAVNAGGTSSSSNTIAVTSAPPLMTITSPDGSASWKAGTKQAIRWTYNGTPGSKVRIELLEAGSVTKIASSVSSGKGGSGSYTWTLPSTLKGTEYQVRVTSTTNSSYTATGSHFTVDGPTIHLNAIGDMTAGEKCQLSWTYTGSPGNVKIEIYQGDSYVKTIKSNTSAGKNNAGSYTWAIPNTQTTGDNYKIKVTAVASSECYDTSNIFKIAGPTIDLNPIQNSTAGNKLSISWKYTGSPGNVKIELLQGGSPIQTIKSGTSVGRNNAGSYTWSIPKTQATGAYQVRVTAIGSSECFDTSISFNIAGPTIILNPIQNSTAGGKLSISWSYTGSPGNVKIELLQGGSPIKTIQPSISAGKNTAGSYTWTIPKTQAAGSDYQVRVTAIADSSCGDTSLAFSIGSVQASAGPDQQAKSSVVVNLSGLNSTGVSEVSASYRWTQTAGPSVELSDPNAAETIFLAPESDTDGKSLGFQLTVTNSEGVKAEDSCIINVSENNAAPIAEAGPNQVVQVAQIVELDGARSSASGSIVSYGWRQVSGTPVTLTDASAMQTTFVAPDVAAMGVSLVFELTVTDQAGLRSRDTCVVNVILENQPPIANAGQNQTVRPGSIVVLDGTGSFDEDSAIASYRWKQLSGKPVTLSDPAAVAPSFFAPAIDGNVEELVFQLVVADAGGLQGSAKSTVFVEEKGVSH